MMGKNGFFSEKTSLEMLNITSNIKMNNPCIVDTRVLLWGDNTISVKENKKLFSYVKLFIKKSGRFGSIVFMSFHVYYIYCI